MSKGQAAGWAAGAVAVLLAAAGAWWSFHYGQARQTCREAQRIVDSDPERARQLLAPCRAWWRDRSDIRLVAARAARLTKSYDEAEEHLAYCESHGGVAEMALRRERAFLQVQQGDFHGHLALLAPHGPSDPQLPVPVLEALAHGYADTFFIDTALECLQRLFQNDPDHARGHVLAGKLLMASPQYEQAVIEFAHAVRQLPDALTPRLRLAECLLEHGDLREAATHLEALCARYPDEPAVLLAQARLDLYRARPAEAKQALEQVLAARPDHVDALLELGRLEFQHGDARRAATVLQQALRVHPDQADAWETLSHCQEHLGQADEARRSAAERDRVARAHGAITRLIRVSQGGGKLGLEERMDLAGRYERLHADSDAVGWYFCVLQLDAGYRPAHERLAALFERTGQPHRAARHRALAGAPVLEKS